MKNFDAKEIFFPCLILEVKTNESMIGDLLDGVWEETKNK